MKKLLSIFSIVALTLILVFPADASIDARERPNGASFHIKMWWTMRRLMVSVETTM